MWKVPQKKQEESMQYEQIVHYKDLPYDCKECNKSFSNMEEMKVYIYRSTTVTKKTESLNCFN